MSESGDTFDFSFDFVSDLSVGGDPDVRKCLTLLDEALGEEALDVVDKVRARDGATPLVRHLLALCICRMGRVVPAIKILKTAHDDSPSAYEHVEVLAALLTVAGERSEGVYYAKLATALKPAYPDYELIPSWLITFHAALLVAADNPIVDNGYLHIQDGALDKAADNFVDAVELNKENVPAWQGLVEVNRLRHRPGDCLRASEALAELDADNPQALRTLARCQVEIGNISDGWETVQQGLAVAGADPSMAQLMPGLVRYDSGAADTLLKDLSDAWNALADKLPVPVKVTERPNDDARFRVGILSGALLSGSERMAYLSTIDECIGRVADLYYYSNSEVEDAVSRRLRRSAVRWREIAKVDDETVATIMRNDEIQVLIDLDGYDWCGRPGVVAQVPAPVVLSMPATTGAHAGSDHGVLSVLEPWMVSRDETPNGAVVVAPGLSTWPLYADLSEEAEQQAAAGNDGSVMHVLMNATAGHLSPVFLECMADAVRRGMVATFTLRGDDPEDGLTTEILSQRFKDVGLDLSTVERVSQKVPLEALLDRADILVDSIPIPNTEPCLTALRQGVPVLALKPARPENAAVASLLFSIGLADWVASDAEEFSQRLADLSHNRDALKQARTSVRQATKNAATLEERNKRGRAFSELFDTLLAKAAEAAQ